MKKPCIILLCIYNIALLSCSYKWESTITTSGNKVWFKEYKNPKKAEAKSNENVFLGKDSYIPLTPYNGKIFSDTSHGYIYIQYDSIRIYLYGGSVDFKSVFTSGLIYGQMLNSPGITENSENKDSLSWPLKSWGWTGTAIMVSNFQILENAGSKPTERRFKFDVAVEQPFDIRTIFNTSVFFLELTNNKANKKNDLETFLKGARLTYLTCAWFEI